MQLHCNAIQHLEYNIHTDNIQIIDESKHFFLGGGVTIFFKCANQIISKSTINSISKILHSRNGGEGGGGDTQRCKPAELEWSQNKIIQEVNLMFVSTATL